MKKQLLLFVSFVLITITSFGQNATYEATMSKNIKQMRDAKTVEEIQQAANMFERIALAEQQAWLPLYYTALSYISMSSQEKQDEKKDLYLDKAQLQLDKALKLEPKESELHVLQGYLHLVRIGVSPMVRGMKYSGLATEALEKAKNLNPNNPRAYFLLGSNKFNTPAMFGGGPDAAKPYLTEAKVKFEKQQLTSSIAPNWGEKQTLYLLEQCK